MPRQREFGFVRPPSPEQLQEYAQRHNMRLDAAAAADLAPIMAGMVQLYDVLDEIPEPSPPASPFTTREPGRAPRVEEDPLNAFIRLCRVPGAGEGPLQGLTLAVKDCIAVAGVPLTNGSRMVPTLVPTEDAVVVERLLGAGMTIVGKTNMEDMALGIGPASAFGAVSNPVDEAFDTGGSSSGSGAAVAAGMVDAALGADEAGSVRVPAAWCGVVGMKATHGLVPSYGLTYMEHTIDHIGPITRDVATNARMLNVMAGSDPRDPQWVRGAIPSADYTADLNAPVAGMRVAVIAEALEPAGATSDVLAAFENGLAALRDQGVTVTTVSFPLWSLAWPLEGALLAFGARAMVDSAGAGYGHKGRIPTGTLETTAAQFRLSADDYAVMGRLNLLLAEHMRDQYLGLHYAKAQNLRLWFSRNLEDLASGFDALLTPTTPTVATRREPRRHTAAEMLDRVAGTAVVNTCALDLTGQPALTVPVGPGSHGLPVGMQVIGASFSERNLYRLGSAIERAGLWKGVPSRGPIGQP
jgi:amidase